MSEDGKSASGNLVLGGSGAGLALTGNADNTTSAKAGQQAEEDFVAATINLKNLEKNEVKTLLEALKPYENNMKLLTTKDLSASAGLGSLGLGLNSTGMTQKDLSLDASAKAPTVSVNGPSGELNAEHGISGKISGPTLNGDLPKLGLQTPSADSTLTGLKGPEIKADLGGTPQIKSPNASLNIEKPNLKTGTYNAPKFTMPQFFLPQSEKPKPEKELSGVVDLPSVNGNLEAPNLNASAPKLNYKSQDIDLNGPDVKLETPSADFNAPSGKFKVKGPDADLNADLSAPDVKVSSPKIDGDLNAPNVDVNLPKANLKGPEVDAETPDAPSGKIHWPHKKWKKLKLHGSKDDLAMDANIDTPRVELSAPRAEGELNAPEIDINTPKTDIKAPELNADVKSQAGKINWPHWKLKKPKAKGPKTDLDIGDLNTPDVNLTAPTVKGDINVPKAELDLPKADLTGPDADIHGPDLDVDSTSGKFNWPHQNWKKLKIQGPKADVDGSFNAPDVDLSGPKVDGEIRSPDIDVNLPKVDSNVKTPNVDLESPSGKIKWPTFIKPKPAVARPKVNSPDVDLNADVSAPDINLSAPKMDGDINAPDVNVNMPKAELDGPKLNVDAPDANVSVHPGKHKWFTFKKSKTGTLKAPKASLKGPEGDLSPPKVDGLDADLNADVSAPHLNLSAPKIDDGKMNTPDASLNLPKAEVDGTKIDIDAPDMNESPSGKTKWFNLKKPKFGTLKGPKADIDTDPVVPDVDLQGAEVNLSAPKANFSPPKVDGLDADVSAPHLNLSAPKIDGKMDTPDASLNLPKAELGGTKVDIDAPDMNVESPSGKSKWFNLKKPKFGTPKGPKADIDTDPVVPDVDLQGAEVNLSAPKANFSPPKVDGLDADLNADVSAPHLNLSAPKIDGKMNTPDASLNLPKAELGGTKIDIDAPDVSVGSSSVKTKWFNLKKPKLGTPKGPKADIDTDVNVPNADLKVPETDLIAADLSTPVVDLPKLDVDADLKAPNLQGGLKAPDLDLSSPKTKIALPHLKSPGTNINLPKANVKGPGLDLPNADLNLSAPKVDATMKSLNADINLPQADLRGPDGQVKTPNLKLDTNLGDFKMPHFKVPGLDLSGPYAEPPSIRASGEAGIEDSVANISVPAVNLNAPKLKEDAQGPNIDIKSSKIEAETEKSNFPQIKNIFGAKKEAKGDNTDANLEEEADHADALISTPEIPRFKLHRLPSHSLDGTGELPDVLGLSKPDAKEKDFVISKGVRLPVLNTTSKAGNKIDIMAILKTAKEKVMYASQTEGNNDPDLQLANPSLSASASAGNAPKIGGTFKTENLKSVLGLDAPEASAESDENKKLSLSLSNMLGLKIDDDDSDV